MNVLEDIKNRINKTGQDVLKTAKDFSENVRLNSALSEELKRIDGLYLQLGKRYYTLRGNSNDPEFSEYCKIIRESMEKANSYQTEIALLKGSRICANCGAESPANSLYCGACGFRAAIDEAPDKKE